MAYDGSFKRGNQSTQDTCPLPVPPVKKLAWMFGFGDIWLTGNHSYKRLKILGIRMPFGWREKAEAVFDLEEYRNKRQKQPRDQEHQQHCQDQVIVKSFDRHS